MTKYKHIFFDLDRTLWDFDTNSKETFKDIYNNYFLQKNGIENFDKFFTDYQVINHSLWEEYRQGKITKDFLNVDRFHQVLLMYGINDRKMAAEMAKDYITVSPTKKQLFPYAVEILEYLKKQDYHLYIITNGFPEVQHIKLRNSGFEPYFKEVVISEEVGYKKPAPEIFRISLQKADADAKNSVMIGDDLKVDIEGAAAVGMTTIWVNYHHENGEFSPDFEINNLQEIENIL